MYFLNNFYIFVFYLNNPHILVLVNLVFGGYGMKVIFFQKKRRIAAYLLGSFIIGFILINAIGYILNIESISVFSALEVKNKYEVRSNLLMDAMNQVGACSCKEAAQVWANGLKLRSAALQYSVMTKTLKDKYAADLEMTFPNWVTGVSSPWVDSFIITDKDKDGNNCIARIKFSTKTSTGPAGDYNASLTPTFLVLKTSI